MDLWTRYYQGLQRATRAFVTGQATVEPSQVSFGIDPETFAPAEYGTYLATSNGVYACARLRAQLIASLPLKLYKLNRQGERDEVTSGPLYELLTKVNPYWTFSRLVEMMELSLCLWGSAYLFLERGASGRQPPKELWWAKPDRVRVVPDPVNYISGFLYDPANGAQPLRYQREETVWLRYPNPIDQFSGLAPLAAARLAADTASAAMHSNRNLFANGIQMGGFVAPKQGVFTKDQADTLQEGIARRFKGVHNAHRWAVLHFDAQFQSVSMSPKDAEFLGALKWALEDICRAFGVPLDLIGGQRTYENVQAAERALWVNTIRPEAAFIANELTEQLLPLFPGQADLAEFDLAGIEVLHEAESAAWTRAKEQIASGAMLINEWRADRGLDPLPWGDAWWAPVSLSPITSAEPPALPATTEPDQSATESADTAPRRRTRAIAYGSPEHERAWQRFVRRTEPHERKLAEATATLLGRQRSAVLARLRQRAARNVAEVAEDPFDKPRWIKAFRVTARPVLRSVVEEAGQAALDDLGISLSFDVTDANVIRFLEGRAQRFARQVNETTWDALKASLAEGVKAGEGIDDLADRVEAVMGERVRAAAEVIARTETVGAANGGTLLSWKQTGVVTEKRWLAALDERVRETHAEAHGQTVAIDDDFDVGLGSGPAPGQIGLAEEDCNCRCSMTAVLDTAAPERSQNGNGHHPLEQLAAALRVAP